jgi:hypothetical protein
MSEVSGSETEERDDEERDDEERDDEASDEEQQERQELAADGSVVEGKASEVFGELRSTLDADAEADQRYLEEEDLADRLSERVPVSRKMLLTGVLAWALVAVPYLHPSLARFRVLTPPAALATPEEPSAPQAGGPLPDASVGEAKLPGATYDQQGRGRELEGKGVDSRGPIARGGRVEAPSEFAPAVDEKKPPRSIDDPSGKALDNFFAKLARTENKEEGAIARIHYYGDSIVASDFVTGKLRRRMQDRFGDAGHGYAIIANAWPGWFHIDVSRKASDEWRVSTCVGPYAKDGFYGLGCASFTSYRAKIWSKIATATADKWGRKVSRFELEYLKQPDGGAIDLIVDGKPRETIETHADAKKVAWHSVEVPDGKHSLEIRSADKRQARVFGVRMERDVPGLILTASGITGARARFLDKQDDEHWKQLLTHTKSDLFVLAFGSNEISDGLLYPLEKYRETLNAVMDQVEKALPDASYMLVGPPDMGSKNAAMGHSRPMCGVIVKEQKKIAAERGWAFWDQYRAMGGGGSMWSWMQAGLGSQDMFHPTGRGGNLLGNWQYLALMEAFEKYKAEHR